MRSSSDRARKKTSGHRAQWEKRRRILFSIAKDLASAGGTSELLILKRDRHLREGLLKMVQAVHAELDDLNRMLEEQPS